MSTVNVTELRQHLPRYLEMARRGDELLITSRGRVIARLLPPLRQADHAREALQALRQKAVIGDVVSPVGQRWDAEDAGP